MCLEVSAAHEPDHVAGGDAEDIGGITRAHPAGRRLRLHLYTSTALFGADLLQPATFSGSLAFTPPPSELLDRGPLQRGRGPRKGRFSMRPFLVYQSMVGTGHPTISAAWGQVTHSSPEVIRRS